MTIPRYSALSILIALPLLAGCDDKQSANADDFQRALQNYHKDHAECVALPIGVPLGEPVSGSDPQRRQLDAMAGAGLLSATPAPTPGATQYALSATGETAILKGDDPFLGGMRLCYAHRHILEVVSFTAPAEIMGVKVSRATYAYELRDIAPWAGADLLQEAFPQIKTALGASKQTDTEGLALTSSGWVDERMVR